MSESTHSGEPPVAKPADADSTPPPDRPQPVEEKADADPGDPAEPAPDNETGPEDAARASRSLLTTRAKEVFTGSDGNPRAADMSDPKERGLRIFQSVSETDQPNFDFGNTPGEHDILLSLDYDDVSIKDGRLAGIAGGTKDTVTCYFLDTKGEQYKNTDGDWVGVPIPREQLADLTLKAYQTELTDMFEGDDQKAVTDHIAQIDAGTLKYEQSDAQDTSQSEATPRDERKTDDPAAVVIRNQIERLRKEMGKIPEDQRGGKDYLTRSNLVANLEMAQITTGDYGALIRKSVLEQVRKQGNVSQFDVEALLRNSDFTDEVAQSGKKLSAFIDGDSNKFTEAEKRALQNGIQNPAELSKIMASDKFGDASQEIVRGFFGHDVSDTDISNTITNLVDSNNALVDTTLRGKIGEYFRHGKVKKLSLLAALLLAVPAGTAILVGGAATAAAASAVSSAGGRR